MICDLTAVGNSIASQFSSADFSQPYNFALLIGASLLVSPHCAVMCGPMLGVKSKDLSTSDLIIYNLARLISYSIVGGTLAVAGHELFDHFGKGPKIAMAVFLLFYALIQLAKVPKRRCNGCVKANTCQNRNLFAIGALSSFIPCMSLAPMFFLASLQGSFVKGALILLAFGLGTLPMMTSVGLALIKMNNFQIENALKWLQTIFSLIVAAYALNWLA